jgi:hypothetical protein
VVGQKLNDLFTFLVPDLDSSQLAGIFMMNIESHHLDDLVAQDVSMLGKRPLLQNPVTGVILLPGDEVNIAFVPSPKELVIDIPSVDCHNRTRRKSHRPGNLHLVDLAFGDVSKYRQVSVMVLKQMEFHRFQCPKPILDGYDSSLQFKLKIIDKVLVRLHATGL